MILILKTMCDKSEFSILYYLEFYIFFHFFVSLSQCCLTGGMNEPGMQSLYMD